MSCGYHTRFLGTSQVLEILWYLLPYVNHTVCTITVHLWQRLFFFCLTYLLPAHPFIPFSLYPAHSLRQYLDVTTRQHACTHIWTFAISHDNAHACTQTRAHTHAQMLALALTFQHTHKQFHLFLLFPVACDGTDTLSLLISVKPLSDIFSGDVRQGGRLRDVMYERKQIGERREERRGQQ